MTREIVGRRGRPAKAPLSRDAIVAAALDILGQDGLSGLNLRKVAAALDTGAASLYVYVANLQELYALMFDRALGEVKVPEVDNTAWQDRLKTILVSYLQVLYGKPGLAQIAMSTVPLGLNSLRIMESILGLLKEGRIDDHKAAWGVDLLTLYVTATAAEQSVRQCHTGESEPAGHTLSSVSEHEFPIVFALKNELLSGGSSRAYWAIDVMINGIIHSPLPSEAKALDEA